MALLSIEFTHRRRVHAGCFLVPDGNRAVEVQSTSTIVRISPPTKGALMESTRDPSMPTPDVERRMMTREVASRSN